MTSHGPFIWTQLYLPLPLTSSAARAALTALANMAGNPRIVLEATGSNGTTFWRLGCDATVASRAVAAIAPHLFGMRTERTSANDGKLRCVAEAAQVSFRGPNETPLRIEATEPVTRSILGALSAAKKKETAHLQLVLGPRYRPSHSRTSPRPTRRDAAKTSEHRFGCAIRIAASSPDSARVRTLIGGVAASLRGLEVPGIRVSLTRRSNATFSEARTPWLWPDQLSVDDLVPLLAWPVGDLPLPGVPAAHPKLLPIAASVPTSGRVLGIATASRTDRPVAIKVEDSLRHLHLIGPTGVGKSTVLAHLAIDSLQAGHGGVVIDPKGDLVEDILRRVPDDRLDDVVLLDPRDASPVGIAALAGDPDLAADTLLGTFHSLYTDSWGPRTQDILHACLLTLARRGDASILLIPMLLTNPGFRRSVIGRVVKADPMGLGTFWGWFEGISEAERQNAIAPLMNKLRPIALRPALRGVLGQRQPRFSFSDIFEKKRFLLVNLPKGTIGPEASQLLGSLVVSLTWSAALARSGMPSPTRHPVMIYVDELQDYLRLPGDLGDALAQARGLGVGFTLAHQHLGQLSPSIKSAVMANARSRVAFGLSPSDARDLAKTTRGELSHEDFQSLPAFQAYASLLVDGTTAPWLSLSTQPLPRPTRPSADVRNRSRDLYGQPLDEVEADLLSLIDNRAKSDDPIGRVPKGGSDD